MKAKIVLVGWMLATFASVLGAQVGPEKGATEVQIWTSGGHSVSGGRGDTGLWNAGLRYGWVLTGSHGPGFVKGKFEYAVDAVPVYLIFQPSSSVYGVGLNPLNLKWNFRQHGNVSPYLELSGGTLFTTDKVPARTSAVNFTSGAALGTHFLGRNAWALEARYMHISNAGLGDLNPGINLFEIRLGVGRFRMH
ncbi:MAG TPA: acyloxyacyl hydrolase [Terriglobales bacterium]|jgi:lipid A 3-O-deacylase|nr:acyloxyacyl hydrolase [Terriglobales bacterium]